jgi:hypothetical protein
MLLQPVVARLLQIDDERRLRERIDGQGLDLGLASALGSQAPRIFYAKDLVKPLKKSLKWIYHHAEELGGTRIGRTWIFSEEAIRNALLGQGQTVVAGDRSMARTKVQESMQSQTASRRVGSPAPKGTGRTGDSEDTRDHNRHGLADPL